MVTNHVVQDLSWAWNYSPYNAERYNVKEGRMSIGNKNFKFNICRLLCVCARARGILRGKSTAMYSTLDTRTMTRMYVCMYVCAIHSDRERGRKPLAVRKVVRYCQKAEVRYSARQQCSEIRTGILRRTTLLCTIHKTQNVHTTVRIRYSKSSSLENRSINQPPHQAFYVTRHTQEKRMQRRTIWLYLP